MPGTWHPLRCLRRWVLLVMRSVEDRRSQTGGRKRGQENGAIKNKEQGVMVRMGGECHPHALFPRNPQPRLSMRKKTSDNPTPRGSLQDTWPIILQPVEIVKNKERPRNCHGSEQPREKWQLNVMWYPGGGPGTEKGQYRKTNKSRIMSEVSPTN